MQEERLILPRDKRVDRDAPVIPKMVEISVAHSTIQDLYAHIISPILPSYHQHQEEREHDA